MVDPDSEELTFIVLARGTSSANLDIVDECKPSKMIGDVNLFFKGSPSDDDFEVEAEIMIAGAFSAFLPLLFPVFIKRPYIRKGFPT